MTQLCCAVQSSYGEKIGRVSWLASLRVTRSKCQPLVAKQKTERELKKEMREKELSNFQKKFRYRLGFKAWRELGFGLYSVLAVICASFSVQSAVWLFDLAKLIPKMFDQIPLMKPELFAGAQFTFEQHVFLMGVGAALALVMAVVGCAFWGILAGVNAINAWHFFKATRTEFLTKR